MSLNHLFHYSPFSLWNKNRVFSSTRIMVHNLWNSQTYFLMAASEWIWDMFPFCRKAKFLSTRFSRFHKMNDLKWFKSKWSITFSPLDGSRDSNCNLSLYCTISGLSTRLKILTRHISNDGPVAIQPDNS